MSLKKYELYSIIVPSYNRQDEVKDLIKSFNALDFPKNKFELVIVDDGSTDGTAEYLRSIHAKLELNLVIIEQENQGPGAARNNGMQNSNGDFLIIIDSDCTVPQEWLNHIDSRLNEEQADAFGGPDSYRSDFPALLKAINYSMTSFLTTGGLRGRKGKNLAKFYPRSFNMGLSRKLFQQIGGFNQMYYGEDIEFSNRIIKSNAKVLFIEDAFVYHKRRTNIPKFFRQVFRMGAARVTLFTIDPTLLEPLHAVPAFLFLITTAVLLLAVFFTLFRLVLLIGLLLTAGILIYAMLDSVRIYRQIIPGLWLPVIIPLQVSAYASGFLVGFIKIFLLTKKEKVIA